MHENLSAMMFFLGCEVTSMDAHMVIDHHGTLQSTQGTACKGAFASNFDPGFSSSVINIQQYNRVEIGWIRVIEEIDVRSGVIDQLRCVVEDIDAGELSVFATSDEDQCVLVELFGPLNVTPEIHVGNPTAGCVETALIPYFDAGVVAD